MLRFLIPTLVVCYLGHLIFNDPDLVRLRWQSNALTRIALALLLAFTGTAITILRWRLMLKALGLTIPFLEAIRVGFVAELFNLFLIGGVGGDVVKATFVANSFPNQRIRGISATLLDRVVGLYSLLLMSTFGIAAFSLFFTLPILIKTLGLALAASLLIATLFLISPFIIPHWFWDFRHSKLIPRIARQPVKDALSATLGYRRRPSALILATGLTLTTQILLAMAFWLIATSVLQTAPSFGHHLVLLPTASVTGILPLPFGGLGIFEGTIGTLYESFTYGAIPASYGVVSSLGYRLVSLVIVIPGVICWSLSRSQVSNQSIRAKTQLNPAATLKNDCRQRQPELQDSGRSRTDIAPVPSKA